MTPQALELFLGIPEHYIIFHSLLTMTYLFFNHHYFMDLAFNFCHFIGEPLFCVL